MEELRRIRKGRGWSQQRLADLAGVDKVTVVHIEGGKVSPKVATLEKLTAALGVEMADLFPKAQAPLPLEGDGRRSPLAPWAAYARHVAARIRSHAADPQSAAFRDAFAGLFFVEERNRDAAELWRLFEEELGFEPLADEPLAALDPVLAAFEKLAEALAEAQRRAEQMAAGLEGSEIGLARRRAAEAATQRAQAGARVSTRLERSA